MPHHHSHPISRRKFIGQASCATVGSISLLSTLLNLRLASSAAAAGVPPNGDYRALVCLFFSGGMDSFNLLKPASIEEDLYNSYCLARGGVYNSVSNETGLALTSASGDFLNHLNPAETGNYEYRKLAVHHACASDFADGQTGIRGLYNTGQLAFITNVGTLVHRFTSNTEYATVANRPRGLYSHVDQIQQWHTSIPNDTVGRGWAGRAADLIHDIYNPGGKVSMNISLGGNNLWQTGRSIVPYSIGPDGSLLPEDYNSPLIAPATGFDNHTAIRTAGIDSLAQQQYQNLFERTFTNKLGGAVDDSVLFTNAYSTGAGTLLDDTPFPGDAAYYTNYTAYTATNDPAARLGQQLKAVIRTIAAREALGLSRQTFFVNYGGWDHHDEVIHNMDVMLDVVNRCVAAYWRALGPSGLNLRDKVTLYTASDFGRTLTSNGNGSDHAWGGNMFALGGGVKGGKVYGTYPNLNLNLGSNNNLATDRGAIIPRWATDEYFAELALWLGVSKTDLPTVLPNIGNFYNISSSGQPIGFMNLV